MNATGTEAVARAASASGITRFVHISSLAAREPQLSHYGASKRAGEDIVQRHVAAGKLLIIRPPAVYGPGDKATLPLLKALTGTTAIIPGGRASRFSLIHVHDLARGIAMAVESDVAGVVEVSDGTPGGYGHGHLYAGRGGTMTRTPPEPVHIIKERREAVLKALVGGVPYISYLGIQFDRRGDELTAVLPFRGDLIGNPMLPALHGGVVAALMELTAITQLAIASKSAKFPKTIDVGFDYLRSGKPVDTYARARVVKIGRRIANVQAEAWQGQRDQPIAAMHGHFLVGEDETKAS